MYFERILVTPEIAKEWLARGGKNRPVSKKQVDIIAKAIKDGNWIETGDTVSFGIDGRLQNGQHRLCAVIQAGIAVYMNICMGVTDKRAFQIYDRGLRKRTTGQVLDMEGGKHGTAIAAIARRLKVWDITPLKNMYDVTGHYNSIVTEMDILDYARDNKTEITYYYDLMRNSKPYRQCGAGSALVAAIVLCGRVDREITTSFMANLTSGINMEADNPAFLLRERITDKRRKSGHEWETELMALTIKAWNKYASYEPVKVLKWVNREIFPIPGR